MNDLDFIRNFSKISIKGVCKKVNVQRPNVLNGTTTKDNIRKVREEIENQVARLYIKE